MRALFLKLCEWRDDVRRAFREFLALPACLLIAFAVLAAATTAVDSGAVETLNQVRSALQKRLFSDPQYVSDLLGTIAGGMIAITSFSFGLLLLAVQQTAASMTSHVIDQFLRRRINQLFFGFFVGLALYALLLMGTVSASRVPVVGAVVALVLVGIALCLLIVLLYTTINQMRPVVVIEALHDLTLTARQRQLGLLRRTRSTPLLAAASFETPVRVSNGGYVVRVDIGALGKALDPMRGEAEVILLVSIGSFVAWGDAIALVRARTSHQADPIRKATLAAISLEQQRDVDRDPAYGIEQMLTIAWTSVSSSKSNPAPGLMTIRSLRDLLARWTDEAPDDGGCGDDASLPVVYHDNVLAQLMDAFEALAVISTESMQHQAFAEVVRALAALFHRLPPELQVRAADLTARILSGLGDHVLTADLERAVDSLIDALIRAKHSETAQAVIDARRALGTSIGKLNSRSTRVNPQA